MQNFLRSDDSDNLIHWDWTLRWDGGLVMFLGMNFRTEVHIVGMPNGDGYKDALVEQIRGDFAAYGQQMKEIRKNLEHWTEFVNPYQRVRRSVTRLRLSLDGLRLRPETDRFDPFGPDANQATQAEVAAKWGDLSERYTQAFGLCFGIRSMLPVVAEAFVNLLIYFLMRPEIRKDPRLTDNVFRQPIDVRVKSLSINCIGFKRQPDYASDECRAYHSIVNERNDLLHGNVVVDKLKFNEAYFWGKVPVFKQYRSAWERSLQIEIDSVGLQAVEAEMATVDAFIVYLLSCLEDPVKNNVEMVVDKHELGLNHETGRIGVLFPEWLVDMRAGLPADETGQPDADGKGSPTVDGIGTVTTKPSQPIDGEE
jgi:hypothetical protein